MTRFTNGIAMRSTLQFGCAVGALVVATTAVARAPVAPPPPPSAQAQEPASNAPQNTDIIVTAQFRSQRLQDTPIAITAVNAETMEARSQTNLAQVADSAPNVTLKPQGASFGPSITASIRGVGQNDFNPAFEPGVGIYIDDVYYPQLTGAVFDLLDLDRVEILRGPQGTLAGRNSEGGAIKMYSKKPTAQGGGFVEATYGSHKRIGIRGSANFTLANNVFGRISGVFKRQDGYVDQLDFGCVYPAGGPATFTANDGTTKLLNPAGGIPRTRPAGDCRIGKLGGVGYQAIRGQLRFTPAPNIDLNLSADYTHDEHTIPGEVLIGTAIVNNPNTNINGIPYDNRFICGRFCNFSTTSQPAAVYHGVVPPFATPLLATQGDNQSKYDGYNLSANLHVGLSDMFSFDNILAYQHFNTSFDSDDDLSPIPLNLGQNRLSHYNFSEELRLNAKLGSNINAVLGGYYFKQDTHYFSYQDIRYIGIGGNTYGAPGLGVFPLQFIQPDFTPADSKAVFLNAGWEIIHNLNLNAGVRYTKEAKEYHYFRLNPDGTVNAFLDPVGAANGIGYSGPNGTALSGAVARYKGSKVDYRVALDYRFSPELLAYASVSTGFKGGGTNPRPFNAGQVISFGPETLTNYETGFKSDLFDRRLRFNASVFHEEIKGLQIPVLACPGSPCAARLNAGNAKADGFEAELTARPVEGFLIDSSLSYIKFKFKNLAPSAAYPTNPAGVDLTDPQLGVPKWKWSVGAQYEIPLGDAGSITPRVDADYQGKLYTGPTVIGGVRSLNFIPSYTMVNGRLTWRNLGRDLEISAEVTNLTNKYYFLTNFNLSGLGTGFNKSQPGRPREWALSLKKKF
jgi:iron complex outermembrane receptor protein